MFDMDYSKLRAQARQALHGKWTWAVILTLLTGIMCGIIYWLIGDVAILVISLITTGVLYALLDLVDTGKNESNYFSAMFSAFTKDRAIPVFLNWLLSTIFISLWTLLLVVPGIIKAIAYSQSQYIVKDMVDSGQDLTATEAISKSRELMQGHKWEYFVLQLTFIGWYLLGIISFGIGMLWVTPYVETTNAEYYRKLAGDKFKTPMTKA